MTDLCNRPLSKLGEQLSGHRRREKEKRREREGRCDRVADPSAFLSEN